jgi:hypothetical protein
VTGHPFDLLARELGGAAERQIAAAPRRGARSRLRLLLLTAIAGLGISAAAWAAGSLLSSGDPVTYRYGPPPTSDTHYGTTVAGSTELLADDVPDPDGGLPWGARTFTTTRGYGCLQVGRVQEGKLGVLALVRRDGKVTGRGQFHELRPAVLSQSTTCVPLDGDGHAFVALHDLMTSDAVPSPCLHRFDGSGTPGCRGEGLRTVDVGLLGPRAESITFRAGAETRTAKTLGDAGGYLVVQRQVKPATRPQKLGRRIVQMGIEPPISLSPASAVIKRVAYRGAPACTVRPVMSGRGACPDPPGFTPIPQPSAKDVHTTIRAFAAPDRRGIRLRFRARAAVKDGRSAYNVLIRFPRGPCPVRRLSAAERAAFAGKTCYGGAYGTDLARNVAAGEMIRTTIDLPNIGLKHRPALRPGVYRVDVSYRVQPPRPRITGSLAYPGYRVGGARVVVK